MPPPVAPRPNVPPSETSRVVAAAPVLTVPVSTMSSAVTESVLPPVFRALDAARVNVPLPLSSLSASTVVAPALVRLSFRVTPFCAFRVSAPAPVMPPVVALSAMPAAEVRVAPA